MVARLSAFVLWALVAATAVFWGLRLFVRAPAAPAYVVPVGDATAVRGDLSRLLGSAPVATAAVVAAPEAASRFRLLGIMAPKGTPSPGQGVALIAVDGKMPKAFQVGARVDTNLVLQSVSLRTVSIAGEGGAPAITLELPPLAAPATGRLPVGGSPVPALPAPSLPLPPAPAITPQVIPQIAPQQVPASQLSLPSPPGDPSAARPEAGAPTK